MTAHELRRVAGYGIAIALVVAGLGGCVVPGEFAQTLVAPIGADDPDERAYDLGHKLGRRDAARERAADYTHHGRGYDVETEQSFATGYRDGYAGRGNRMGAPETRDWLYGREAAER